MRRWVAKLTHLFRRQRAESDLTREVAAHLAMLEDEFQSQGMSAAEARLAARRSYGNVEVAKEQHRDERSFVWLEALWQDLRHACRSLAKSRGFVAVAVLSLAGGIGVNTAIFTLLNGIVLKRLPVPDPERIVKVSAQFPGGGATLETSFFSFPAFRELRRQEALFEDLVGILPRRAILDLEGLPQTIEMELVTGSYFQFAGVQPFLGQVFEEQDDAVEGAPIVCVLGYQAWQNYFNGDPGVLDRVIEVNGVPMRIVGVAPSDFVGSALQRRSDLWVPSIAFSAWGGERESPNMAWLNVLGRLQPGVSLTAASARLREVSPAIEAALPPERGMNRDSVYLLQDGSRGVDEWRSLHDPLLILMGAVLLVLLVACANLANLLLARMNDRSQEFAVKLSLGISRSRLLRQLFIETLMVAAVGGAAALFLSSALTRFTLALFNEGTRYGILQVTPNSKVFVFALGTCLATAVIAGLYPAWRASRTGFNLGPISKSVSGMQRSFARRTLVLVQVSLAVVLLFGSILFAHSLTQLKTMDLGFNADRVLTVEWGRRDSAAQRKPDSALALDELLERTRGLPNVESAAFASTAILTGGMTGSSFETTNQNGEVVSVENAKMISVGTGYFETLEMPLLQGRDFATSDRRGAPAVVIVNERLASQAWPGEDAVGKRIRGNLAGEAVIIGVVGNSKYQGIREETEPIAYRAFAQFNQGVGALQVRYRGSAAAAEKDIRELVDSTAPYFQVSNASTMEKLRDRLIAQDRLLAFLSSLFGLLGVGLALVGIYGLISYSVTQRTHEIGVRVSVGAQRSQIVRLVLSEAAALLSLGLLAGIPLALALSRWLESLLYEVAPSDPLHITVTLGLLFLGGVIASYLPALRATRIHPLEALRSE